MSPKSRIYSLDIIRGIAATSVFLTHLGNHTPEASSFHMTIQILHDFQHVFLWCNGGLHWAVIVFIVLSGFCIHMPSAKRGMEEIIIPYYARRRFFRIYPVLTFAIVLGYLVSFIDNIDSSYAVNLIGNLSLLSGILNCFSAPLGNAILITVVVECLLYIVYPIFLPRNKRQWIYILITVLCIHFLNFSFLLFTEIDPTWLQRNLFSFLAYWWIGAFFAEVSFNKEKWNIKQNNDIKNIFLFFMMYSAYVVVSNLVDFKGAHTFKSLWLAIITGLFLFGMISMKIKKNEERKVSNGVVFMSKIGEYSYSLYVVHMPIITLLSYFAIDSVFKNTVLFYFVNIFAVIISTVLFYKFIEKPSHEYAKISSNKALHQILAPRATDAGH